MFQCPHINNCLGQSGKVGIESIRISFGPQLLFYCERMEDSIPMVSR